MKKRSFAGVIAVGMALSVMLLGCGSTVAQAVTETVSGSVQNTEVSAQTEKTKDEPAASPVAVTTGAANSYGTLVDTASQFSERDLLQTPDLSQAKYYTVTDGKDVTITEEGIYVLDGTAGNMTVYVQAGDSDKVQLVLNGVSITNEDIPCISVSSADKVFITTLADSELAVTGTFQSDGETAVIASRDDLVFNGTAKLTIASTDTGVDSKDDLKITGGTYVVTAETKAFEANDSIRIAGGTFQLKAGTDGFHGENNDDDSLGYVYIGDGDFTIEAGDDGIHGTTVIQIDGGVFQIQAAEGMEATSIQINDGTFTISASDDGINAGKKSKAYDVSIEINGGDFTIAMAAGDTDAIDSNGNLTINGGNFNISAMSAFDYDGTGTYNGGTLIVNGETVTELTQRMMGGFGGMGRGGFGGMGERPEGMEERPGDMGDPPGKMGGRGGFPQGAPPAQQ